jgi:hypothetical protein
MNTQQQFSLQQIQNNQGFMSIGIFPQNKTSGKLHFFS